MGCQWRDGGGNALHPDGDAGQTIARRRSAAVPSDADRPSDPLLFATGPDRGARIHLLGVLTRPRFVRCRHCRCCRCRPLASARCSSLLQMFSAASSASSTASVTLKLGVEFVSAYYSALVNDTANLYTFYEVRNRGEGRREDGQ